MAIEQQAKDTPSPSVRDEGATHAGKQRWQAFGYAAMLYTAVAVGSIIGGSGRWLVSELLHAGFPYALPWGTLAVNVTGSFVIGFYAAITGPDGRISASAVQRQFVMTGICGGYTTFSVFSLETVRLAEAGQLSLAGLNVSLSLAGCLVAVWRGFVLATWLSRLAR
jgi:CrcB protein